MSPVIERIEAAFARLSEREGFVLRENQRQLALILGDLIDSGSSGAVEAPTGLGKSLAALIPAIAHALEHDRRIVIATYTNVLAEQYWLKDLPLALSLFGLNAKGEGDQESIRPTFLIGRQRYACLMAMDEHAADEVDGFRTHAELGSENEFRRLVKRPVREMLNLWQAVAAPPVCAGKGCPLFDDCYYYEARRRAEKANIIITNHNVVLQDAINAQTSDEGTGFLGKLDFIVIDEAHDLYASALNALEFEISPAKLTALQSMGGRLERELIQTAVGAHAEPMWRKTCADFQKDVERAKRELLAYGLSHSKNGILAVAPEEVVDHPGVKQMSTPQGGVEEVTDAIGDACRLFTLRTRQLLESWDASRLTQETARNYLQYIDEVALTADTLLTPRGVSVSFSGRSGQDPMLRMDTVGLDGPLKELLWDRIPTMCISATLALDGNFEFFARTVGCAPEYQEILPSPFDYARDAALYLPPAGRLPDPTQARRDGSEEVYYAALAAELSKIIIAMQGRTLALFHSRKEMEGVYTKLAIPADLPIYIQPRSGAGAIGDLFRKKPESSLLALRSFWTGFDAPGETLSCVVIVRVPFEVPFEPPAVVRMAYLASQGFDPFQAHTLPMAKMMVRQGAGRLIRKDGDKGIIALLDPRLRTKRYGEDILNNLPSDMRQFDDIEEAVAWTGLA